MTHTGTPYIDASASPRSSRRRAGKAHGFTLVELMITIAVAAVLLAIAVPSFKHVIASTKLTSTANGVVDAINTARMEAIKRNADTQLCSNNTASNTADTLGAACGTQAAAVYLLAAATTTVKVHAGTVLTDGAQHLVGDITPVRFDARGLAHAIGNTAPYTGPIATICTQAYSAQNARIISVTTGTIVSVAKTTQEPCL